MIPLFLGLSIFNLLCLTITASLGYAVMFAGPRFSPYHQLSGVLTTIACCAVHCIVFTYFIATAKWVQHAIDLRKLDPQLAAPTRSFKSLAFPSALLSMFIVFVTAVVGVATFSYGLRPWYHHALALLAIVINARAAMVEYRAVVQNGRLIDSILAMVNST